VTVEGKERLHYLLLLWFQSSPSPEARSYWVIVVRERWIALFQSSPSPEARSYLRRSRRASLRGFQSSPSPEARSYPRTSTKMLASILFQSSPSPEARSYLITALALLVPGVPILSQPGGQELPS
jgi:hypothetical protein